MDTDNPRENVRQKKEALYRSLLLEAAEQAFASEAYEAVRIPDIAARAGVSVGTLYGVFPEGKWALYVAVHVHHVSALMQAAGRFALEAGSALEALREGSVMYTRYLAEHPSYLRMHLREGYAWTTSSQFRSGEQVEAWQRGMALVASLFARAIADGDVHPGEPTLYAKLMVGMQQVQLADWVERSMREPLDALLARVMTMFDRTFMRP